MSDSSPETPQTPAAQFISYSGNSEDVILHRLFGNRKRGFYVDVGAGHPTFENDMRALSDQGWSGINIEPNPTFFAELAAARPLDRNLQVCVSDEEGTLDYWEVVGTGLSTCDPDEAVRAREKGFTVQRIGMTCTTLARLLDEAQSPSIDVLKVDVEGFELRVLQGNDWTRHRPRVVLVEATYPETPTRRPDRIRPFLEQHGYEFAYFDGLNDFFVERGFSIPDEAFRPPNVFDRVVPYSLVSLREHAANLEKAQAAKDEFVESLRLHLGLLQEKRASQDEALRELQTQLALARADDTSVDALRAELAALESARTEQDKEVSVLLSEIATARSQASRHEASAARMHHEAAIRQMQATRDHDEAARAIEALTASSELVLRLRREIARKAAMEAKLHRSIADHASILQRADDTARDLRQENASLMLSLGREIADKAVVEAELDRSTADHVSALQRADDTARDLRNENASLVTKVAATHASTSWKITRPMRSLAYRLGRR